MNTYIDLEGLHPTTVKILGLHGQEISGDTRLSTLASATKNGNALVVTGPLGVKFWMCASPSIKVVIIPENVEYTERETIDDWSYFQVTDETTAKKLVARKSPPTRGALVAPYYKAKALAAQLRALVETAEPLGEIEKVILHDDSALDRHELVALDWEWQRSNYDPLGLAISNADSNWYVPTRTRDKVFHTVEIARERFSQALRDGLPVVFHNGRADIGTQYDSDPIELFGKPIDDTLLMGYLADPYSEDLGLKTLTTKYLNRHAIPYPGDVELLPLETAAQYAAGSDTRNTYDLRRVLVSELIRTKQWKLYTDIERPLVPVVASMEKLGVYVDMERVLEAYKSYATIEAGIIGHYRDRGYRIRHKPSSDSAEYTRYITDTLGHAPGDLDQRTLSGYTNGEIDLALYHRQTRTRRNNFLKRLIREWVLAGRPSTFTIHPRYNQAGSAKRGEGFGRAPRTGRFSSSNPNFQQQPRDLRYIYIAPPNCKWFKYDYKQLELRLAANLSGDKNLINDLLTGDPHGVFQRYIYETTGQNIQRPVAKTANFEKLYFGGDAQLVRVLQKERVFIDLRLAHVIGRAHASRYGQYYEYGNGVIQAARTNDDGVGMVRTKYNRLRAIPEISSSDPTVRQHGERAAVNHTIQGYAADLVKLVMGMLVPVMNKYGAHMAIQVHDEIDGWVPNTVDTVAFDKDVRDCMQSLQVGTVPLLVEGGIYDSWAG